MRYARLLSVILLLALAVPAGVRGQGKTGLPERYKKWVDEEVGYIITRHERDVFLKLQTDRERDIFVEAFWKHRDPVPETPRNEFEEEHYRRLNYANATFGRSTPLPGWKTDRGRIHILLGPPRNIEQYTNVNGVYPVEIWFYLGDESLGLPTGFNVIFFKRNGTGDYVLYSPSVDGPRSLIADAMGGFRDTTRISGSYSEDQAAYKALQELEPNLARQTLSLIPNEGTPTGLGSLASERLMATIFAVPQKKVQDDYADAILRYKDSVEVEYTANYISSEVQVQVIRDESGAAFVNYTIEPAKITAEEIDGKYEVRFMLNGRVSDASGKTVYQFDKDFPFSLTADELEGLRAKSLSIQDVFPLVPGSYNFDILLKNVLSKEFTGAAKPLVVPAAGGAVGMSPLLLAYGVETKPVPAGERVPFKTGSAQLLCQTRKTFSAGDQLVLFYPALRADRRSQGLGHAPLRLPEGGPGVPHEDREGRVRQGPSPASSTSSLSRISLPAIIRPGSPFSTGRGRTSPRRKRPLRSRPPRPCPGPWSSPRSPRSSETSRTSMRPDSSRSTWATSRRPGPGWPRRTPGPSARRRGRGLRPGALPVSRTMAGSRTSCGLGRGTKPRRRKSRPCSGQACHALGEYQEAATYYASYLARFGANIDILNYLGTCHFQLGNTAEALKAWTKSLELNPNQEKLRALVESLKKK